VRGGGGEGEIGAVHGSAVRREDRSRPWEEPDPPSPRTTTSPASSTSPTTRRRLPLLPPRRRAAPPHYTNAYTSAHGHRDEDDRFPPLVVAPAIEPRWNAPMLRAAAPPLVMPAFVPGWDEGAVAFVNARHFLGLAFPCRRCPPCVATRVRDAAPSRSRLRSRLRSRASPRRPDAPRHRAPHHARVSIPGARFEPWPLSSLVGRRRRVRPVRTAGALSWPRASCTVANREGKREPCPWPP
jgi:hypothetical protein